MCVCLSDSWDQWIPWSALYLSEEPDDGHCTQSHCTCRWSGRSSSNCTCWYVHVRLVTLLISLFFSLSLSLSILLLLSHSDTLDSWIVFNSSLFVCVCVRCSLTPNMQCSACVLCSSIISLFSCLQDLCLVLPSTPPPPCRFSVQRRLSSGQCQEHLFDWSSNRLVACTLVFVVHLEK